MRTIASLIMMLALIGSASAENTYGETIGDMGTGLELTEPDGAAVVGRSDFTPGHQASAPNAAARADLVPSGWEVEGEATGDLDKDGDQDVALVLRNVRSAASKPGLYGPRILVVAFGAENGYERIVENRQLIACIADADVDDCFDASSGGLSIQGGQLIVGLNFFAWSGAWEMWTKSYTFDWHPDALELTQFDWYVTNRSTGATTQSVADFDHNTLGVWKGNIAVDEVTETQTVLDWRAPIRLQDMANGMEFDPLSTE